MSKHISGGPGTGPARESRKGWRTTDPNKQISDVGIPDTSLGRRQAKTFQGEFDVTAPRSVPARKNSEVSGTTPWPEGV